MPSAGFARWAPYFRSVLRIVAASLFMAHGTQKLFAFPLLQPRDPAALASLQGAAGILEVFGGLLLLLGLWTRQVAFVLAGQMAFAYFYAHASRNVWPILNGGELAALYCFLFLYLAAAGGGPLGIDGLRGKGR